MENKRPSVESASTRFSKVRNPYPCGVRTFFAAAKKARHRGQSVENAEIGYVFIPYIDPGFRLTLAVKAVDAYKAGMAAPDLIFRQKTTA